MGYGMRSEAFVPGSTRVETWMPVHSITSQRAHVHDPVPREQQKLDEIPLLDARGGSLAEGLAERLRGHRPVTVWALVLLLGYVLVAAATIVVGFLLVDVLVPIHAIGHNDEAVNTWFASHRDGTRNDVSFVGSSIGDIPVLPALVAIVVIVAALLRRWRVVGFVLGAILIEVATYRIASLIVHRVRPTVPRLDQLPVNQSFPSGHVAASVAVYVAIALLVTSRFPQRWIHIIAWTLAVLLPLAVATSRMYRGMHHPTDAACGLLVGLCAVGISLLATRAATGTAQLRAHDRTAA
jgi:membrane-associated phospholipid phosphatase